MLKAKWKNVEFRVWQAYTGPFLMQVNAHNGQVMIFGPGFKPALYEHTTAAPWDVQDLMRLVEAELSRRLATASETLSGEILGSEMPTLRTVVTTENSLNEVERARLRVLIASQFQYTNTTNIPVRKCSHEGCTTPPLPDSWMCCNHDNQIASGYRRGER